MFLKNSRYYKVDTVDTTDRQGRTVRALKLRPLPPTAGEPNLVASHDQLDVMSHQKYSDGTKFWHIGDANTELEVNTLVHVIGRSIKVPER